MLSVQSVSIFVIFVNGDVFTFYFRLWEVWSISVETMQGLSICLFASRATCCNFATSVRNLRHECALYQSRIFLILKVASVQLHSGKFKGFIFFMEVAICLCLFSSIMPQDWRNCNKEITNILSWDEFRPKLRNQIIRVRLIILVY